jgi:hypothetical protein
MNLLSTNATGNVTGDWLSFRGTFPNTRAHFLIAGDHGGATYSLFWYSLYWRPTETADNTKMLIAKYVDVNTEIMQSIDVADGEVQVVVAGGSGLNAMPKLVF